MKARIQIVLGRYQWMLIYGISELWQNNIAYHFLSRYVSLRSNSYIVYL